MAPRRGNHHPTQNGGFLGNNFVDVGFNLGLDFDPTFGNLVKCCCPNECLRENVNGLMGSSDIRLDELNDVIRVICNYEHCEAGQFMHRDCFDTWEQSVLSYLKSCGRARSWSERQRHQNLWTKKGYDLAFKACACKCGRGHLKKDLDWIPPANGQRKLEDLTDPRRKKKNKKNNQKVTSPAVNLNAEISRVRTGSLSSSTGSVSPPVVHEIGASPNDPFISVFSKKKPPKIDFFSEQSRNGSAGSGIFFRRQDFSAFNNIPAEKLNSLHIKTEDDGNHGNDDSRCFILSTLAAMNMASVCCVLCAQTMEVYDRYPLVNGTFFLSPRQHSKSCLEVKLDGRTQFLSAVCLSCIQGQGAGRRLTCLYCGKLWVGSALLLGSVYSFDIFAALPCCSDRLRCNNCQKQLLPPKQSLSNFSDYSHSLACPHCQAVDTHFVKPLSLCYTKDIISLLSA